MERKLSQAAMHAINPKSSFVMPTETEKEISVAGVFINSILERLMARRIKNNGKGKSIGSTSSHVIIREYNDGIKNRAISLREQFPVNERLEDGRSRYFKQYGMIVDRLS